MYISTYIYTARAHATAFVEVALLSPIIFRFVHSAGRQKESERERAGARARARERERERESERERPRMRESEKERERERREREERETERERVMYSHTPFSPPLHTYRTARSIGRRRCRA
jgi:hypothetical protein